MARNLGHQECWLLYTKLCPPEMILSMEVHLFPVGRPRLCPRRHWHCLHPDDLIRLHHEEAHRPHLDVHASEADCLPALASLLCPGSTARSPIGANPLKCLVPGHLSNQFINLSPNIT